MSLKDRFEEWWISSEFTLSKNQFIAVAVLAAIIGVGWLFYYLRQDVSGTEVKVSKQPAKKESSADLVFVHVAGAVKKPGVYKLPSGSRVIKAIKLAGGFAKDADKDSLNLASKVTDAQKILVAFKNGASNQPGAASADGMVNLNTATAEQLDELPGIGEVIAKRIIEFREEIGSFSSVNQLKDIEGIGEKKFAKLKEKVTL